MNYSSPGNPSNQRAAGKLSKIFDVHSYAILNIGQQVEAQVTKTDTVQLDVREKKHLRNANRSQSKWPAKNPRPMRLPWCA